MTWPPAIHGDVREVVDKVRSILFESPTGLILFGSGSPPAGSGLLALNGVNDPWRYYPHLSAWVSPPFSVTWDAGAVMPVIDPPSVGWWDLLIIDTDSLPRPTMTYAFVSSITGVGETMTEAGAGIAYLSWKYPGNADFADPSYTLPADTRTVMDVLGTDFTGTETTWSEVSIGEPGQFYYDSDAGDLYGPRGVDGAWPYQTTLGMSPVYNNYITGAWTFGGGLRVTSPDGSTWKLLVANDGTFTVESV